MNVTRSAGSGVSLGSSQSLKNISQLTMKLRSCASRKAAIAACAVQLNVCFGSIPDAAGSGWKSDTGWYRTLA
jgi:hypothetical protein